MPARLLRLLSVRRDHLDALVSEQAVKAALSVTPGVFIPSFGLWAVRQQVLRKHNPKIREWLPPKVWTWRAFSPHRPQDLPVLDQQALAHLATHLHGLVLVQWMVDNQSLTFTQWPLRAVRVGTRWALQPQPPRVLPPLPFPAVHEDDPYPLDRLVGVPLEAQLAALAETIYIEQVEVAPVGAFTNIDLLAFEGDTRVAIEVKVRRTGNDDGPEPLRISSTQLETLLQLRDAGWTPHVVVRSVPVTARTPAEVLADGTWHACHAVAMRSALGNVLEVLPALPQLTLETLLAARATRLPSAETPPTVEPVEELRPSRPIHSAKRQRKSRKPEHPVHSTSQPVVDDSAWAGPDRIVTFEGDFAFLHPAHPALVRLGGRRYQHAVAAFLAARTLDADVRAALTDARTLQEAISLGGGVLPRRDWTDVRPEVIKALLRTVFAPDSEQARALITTLPAHLADLRVEHPALHGLRGQAGMNSLQMWRSDLARGAVQDQPMTCIRCDHAREAGWPGLVECTLPGGLSATHGCSGAAVVKGPIVNQEGKVEFSGRLLPLTAIGGASFQLADRPLLTSVE